MTGGWWCGVRPVESGVSAESNSNALTPGMSSGEAHQPVLHAARPRLYAAAVALKLFTPISSSTSRTAAIKPCISFS